MFLFDKEKLRLFKSFRALNKASYQDEDYWKQNKVFTFFNLIYTQLLSYDNNWRRLKSIIKYFLNFKLLKLNISDKIRYIY